MAGKRYISLTSTPQVFRPLQRGIPAGLDPGLSVPELSASHCVPKAFLPGPSDFGTFAGCGFSNRSPGEPDRAAPPLCSQVRGRLPLRLASPACHLTCQGCHEACPRVYICFGDAHTRVSADAWLASAEPQKKLDFNQDECALCHFWPSCCQAVACPPPPETVARSVLHL